jgi:hypothetical protein
MRVAICEARLLRGGDSPFGAVVVHGGRLVSRGHTKDRPAVTSRGTLSYSRSIARRDAPCGRATCGVLVHYA